MQDEVVGMQTGNRSVLQKNRIHGVRMEIDQQIVAAVHNGDMARKPRIEVIGITRSECGVVELDMILPRHEITDGVMADAARSFIEHERVVAAVAEKSVVV